MRQPVPHKWTLRQVESGERDYVPAKKVTEKVELFLNGVKTLEAYGLHPTEGQLQIQSEGSDCEVRRVTLLPAGK